MPAILTDIAILRRPSEPVRNIREGGEIARELTATLRRHNKRMQKQSRSIRVLKGLDPMPKLGVGLSAVQLGIHKQVSVILINDVPKVLMNAVQVDASKVKIEYEEGCLSLPGVTAKTERHLWVTYMTLNHGLITFGTEDPNTLTGRRLFEAIIAQHEVDHNAGLLIDRFLPQHSTQNS